MKDVKIKYETDSENESMESKANKKLIIFGKDVREIPCFRNSFLCGFCCGIVGGMATFLVTSKSLLSSHIAFASLWIGVFTYWIPCRYKYETALIISKEFKLTKNIEKKE